MSYTKGPDRGKVATVSPPGAATWEFFPIGYFEAQKDLRRITTSLRVPIFDSCGARGVLEHCEMPIESSYPPLDIPNVDLWRFLFERQDREYPDKKGS